MEQNAMGLSTIVWFIVSGIIVIALGIIGYFGKRFIEKSDTKMEEIAKKSDTQMKEIAEKSDDRMKEIAEKSDKMITQVTEKFDTTIKEVIEKFDKAIEKLSLTIDKLNENSIKQGVLNEQYSDDIKEIKTDIDTQNEEIGNLKERISDIEKVHKYCSKNRTTKTNQKAKTDE